MLLNALQAQSQAVNTQAAHTKIDTIQSGVMLSISLLPVSAMIVALSAAC
jgi:uncharacterized membrane protein